MSNFVFVPVARPRDGLSREAKRVVRAHAMHKNWSATGTRRRRGHEYREGESVFQIHSTRTPRKEKTGLLNAARSGAAGGLQPFECIGDKVNSATGSDESVRSEEQTAVIEAIVPKGSAISYLAGLQLSNLPGPLNHSIASALHHYLYVFANAIYPPSSPLNVDPIKGIIFPLAMADKASFYAVLSTAMAHQGSLLGLSCSQHALYWKATTLHLINERLTHSNNVTDGTMVAVVVLGSFEHFFGEAQECGAHIAGLSRIIELRGGVRKLQKNRPLHRLATWLDSAHACLLLLEPNYIDNTEVKMIRTAIRKSASKSGKETKKHTPMEVDRFSDTFRNDYETIRDITCVVNEGLSEEAGINSYSVTILASLLIHTDQAPELEPQQLIETTLELSMITLLSHVIAIYQSRPMISLPLFMKVKETLFTLDNIGEDICPSVHLWVLIMVGSACRDSQELRLWYIRRTFNSTAKGDSWVNIKKKLQRYLWIETVCEVPCRSFWEEVMLYKNLILANT